MITMIFIAKMQPLKGDNILENCTGKYKFPELSLGQNYDTDSVILNLGKNRKSFFD